MEARQLKSDANVAAFLNMVNDYAARLHQLENQSLPLQK
jgi:hypothetical protein